MQFQLSRVDNMIKENASKLDNEKYNLHTLFNKATENDAQDLKLLLSYMEAQDDVVQERKDELRDICLEFGINSPLLGDDLYDPNAPDLSREA